MRAAVDNTMRRSALLVLLAVAAAVGPPRQTAAHGVPDVQFQRIYFNNGRVFSEVSVPDGPAQAILETTTDLSNPDWQPASVTHVPLRPAPFTCRLSDEIDTPSMFMRMRYVNDGTLPTSRIRCLHNGYILTVNPRKALAPSSTDDRYRLYVLYAVLVDADTGRIAAVYPSLDDDSAAGAQPAETFGELTTNEYPSPPDTLAPTNLLAWWEAQGVDTNLLSGVDFVDLDGAVVTPGIIDGHFHITSWSKKVPGEGESFGFYADMSDPRYYIDGGTGEHRCTRDVLWRIVADASAYLADSNRPPKIFLHGFLHARVDDPLPDDTPRPTYLFASTNTGCGVTNYNPTYILNRIGVPASGSLEIPTNVCESSVTNWPPLDYETLPGLLVHTSGQACWYNSALLEKFNTIQETFWSAAFDALAVTGFTAPAAPETGEWEFTTATTGGLYTNTAPPYPVDLVVSGGVPVAHIPFEIQRVDESNLTVYARPMLPEAVPLVTAGGPASRRFVPFYRPIPPCITAGVWEDAAAFHGAIPETNGLAYGRWDPMRPYDSNWYSGAELGLIQYFFDDPAGIWRPTGYAEHYVMRDLLAAAVLDPPTVEDAIGFRRNVAAWCHRHGLTGAQDIMFYRRRSNQYEFQSYEALSYDRLLAGETNFFEPRGLTNTVPTGRFFLRTGLYYYMENWEEIDKNLALSRPPGGTSDVESLRAPTNHPEYPGWVEWLGWKIQYDGGIGARTLFSSAPMSKDAATNPYATVDEDGNTVTNKDHSFGLITMTSVQEQVFDSRESAALYWLVRESDPSNAFYNAAISRDWTPLKNGVGYWVGETVNEAQLAADLRLLDHVVMTNGVSTTNDPAARMADKVSILFEQVNSAYDRTLNVLAKVWYEKSVSEVPAQTVAHCLGDGAVDLWVHGIRQLRSEILNFPTNYAELPEHWQNAIPDEAAMAGVDESFTNARFRVEHLLNISPYVVSLVRHPTQGLEADTGPGGRNVVFSVQPSLLLLDGTSIATIGFPKDHELWDIPHGGLTNFWRGVPPQPRSPHHVPCPVFMDYDIPFTLDTDPPSVRDPRPGLNVIASVARTPVQIDPTRWLDQGAAVTNYPLDFLVREVYPPFGKMTNLPVNPMQLSVEQALCAMTFWGAYAGRWDDEMGAIRDTNGWSIADLGRMSPQIAQQIRVGIVNDFIEKFRPAMTIVGGVPVYISPHSTQNWQGRYHRRD